MNRIVLFLATVLVGTPGGLIGEVSFEREIRPLLQKHCVECHGQKKQKGQLRLDARVFVFRGGEHGAVVLAGSAAGSSVYQRLVSRDEGERMPPEGQPLASAEIAAIRDWIEQGAVWPETDADRVASRDVRMEHWAVQPVKRDFRADASIDGFIHSGLSAKGLSMSAEADRRTLIRRLSFDLHGLPPSPERTDQFLRDKDPDAYEKLVDELLASPHYGERWARHWLDIAHYADTHGFERDKVRTNAWRYRDYVIDSLNADKPYNQFIREQIAGDVIDPDNPDAVVATGFLAAGPWDFVGQVETKSDVLRRAARAGDLDDMVTQVVTSTMGVTINCARCHDHKLDPITQREYYALWAVFSGVKRGDRDVNAAEARRIHGEKVRLEGQARQARTELFSLVGGTLDLADMVGGGDGLGSGVRGRGIDLRKGVPVMEKLGYHKDIQTNRLQKVEWLAGAPANPGFVQWVFVPDGRGPVSVAYKREVQGVPATNGHAWDAIRNGMLNAQKNTRVGEVDYARGGHSLLGMHANSGITFDLEKIRQRYGDVDIQFKAQVGFGSAESDMSSRADFSVFADAALKFQRLRMRKSESAAVDVVLNRDAKTLTLIATDGGDGIGSDLLFLGDPHLIFSVKENDSTRDTRGRAGGLRETIAKAMRDLQVLGPVPQVYAVVGDATPGVVRVQRRGNPEDETFAVDPGAFAWVRHAPVTAFGGMDMPEGERRRALAEWITHEENPMTRRVIVNRLWHHHFGRGIVSTPSDFGLGGDTPSHPDLLDWLAEELRRVGWRLKPLHKTIVMSAAYRQSALTQNSEGVAVDAQNRLLWRQNPRRLDAESLRDSVLAVSGNLNPQRGGPGFQDFKYTEAYAPIYEYITSDAPELRRRSIYRFVVRTTPHLFMTTLDCPDPANLTPSRIQTTTALQALTLSNGEFMLQQARHFASRIEGETDSVEAAVRTAFRLAFQRMPGAEELGVGSRFAAANGLFSLCRMLLNTNEFIYID